MHDTNIYYSSDRCSPASVCYQTDRRRFAEKKLKNRKSATGKNFPLRSFPLCGKKYWFERILFFKTKDVSLWS
jgi:hypothetical protein